MTPSRSSFVLIAACGTREFCCVSQATVFIGPSKKVFRLIPMGERRKIGRRMCIGTGFRVRLKELQKLWPLPVRFMRCFASDVGVEFQGPRPSAIPGRGALCACFPDPPPLESGSKGRAHHQHRRTSEIAQTPDVTHKFGKSGSPPIFFWHWGKTRSGPLRLFSRPPPPPLPQFTPAQRAPLPRSCNGPRAQYHICTAAIILQLWQGSAPTDGPPLFPQSPLLLFECGPGGRGGSHKLSVKLRHLRALQREWRALGRHVPLRSRHFTSKRCLGQASSGPSPSALRRVHAPCALRPVGSGSGTSNAPLLRQGPWKSHGLRPCLQPVNKAQVWSTC